MADLFLHLPFARRLRFAEGLHPLAGEAIGRRPNLVVLGAALSGLPGNERRGMGFLRRLFSGGGDAARWQKILAPTGQPRIDLVMAILSGDDAPLGPLARLALGCGVLSHEILEEKLAPSTSSLQGPQRIAVERAQARLWLQGAVPANLEHEWRPVLDLADAEQNKRALQHVDKALKSVHGSGPGEAALARWLKGLAAEVTPLSEGKGPSGALPAPLSVTDHDARGAHFEQAGFVEKAQSAVSYFVSVANRLAEAFTKGSPDRQALVDALGKLGETSVADSKGARERWKVWLDETRVQALTRGRNPKPAFLEGEAIAEHHRIHSATKVMSLADLPPEADPSGAPPIPEASGPIPAMTGPPPAGMPPPPSVTQEVSLAQIEAESKSFEGAAPAHTQQIEAAQIVSGDEFAVPAHTQEIQAVQVVGEDPRSTQPISMAEIARQNAEDAARATALPAEAAATPLAPTAGDVVSAPVALNTDPGAAPAPPVSAESAPAAATAAAPAETATPTAPHTAEGNGANGVAHEQPKQEPAAPPSTEPPRE